MKGTPGPAWLIASGFGMAACAIEVAGNAFGLWWTTLAVGAGIGWLRYRGSAAALGTGTVLAWTVGILWQSGSRAMDVAGIVAGLAIQDRDLGWAVVLITGSYALLLALAGMWLGTGARRLVTTHRRRADPAKEDPVPDEPSIRHPQKEGQRT